MSNRKGLVIGIVIVCLGLAVVTYIVMSPKKSTSGSEYEKLKSRSEEMAEKQLQASPQQQPELDPEDVPRPTGKGPVKIGG